MRSWRTREATFTWEILEDSHSYLDPRHQDDDSFLTILTPGVFSLLRSLELLQGKEHIIRRQDVRFRTSAEGALLSVTIIIRSLKTESEPVSEMLPNMGPFSAARMLHR